MAGASLFQVGENVEFWRVLVHLSILAFCLVLFEKALHRLEHKFPPSQKYQHMLKKVYRELMVLGLISLGLKILKENPNINSYSKTIIAFQVADLIIFFLALVLILQSTIVFLLLRNQNDRADRAELISAHDLVALVNGTTESKTSALWCCGMKAKKKTNNKRIVELKLLRRLFLRRFGLPQLFPFSKYLSRAQAHQISHMIEVEPSMWLVLLGVAWAICGLLYLFETLDSEMPEREELVESFMLVAWVLLLLHLMVFLYLRSCVQYLLRTAAFSEDTNTLVVNLSIIAQEEDKAWQSEEAEKALEIMSRIQEHHEELEYEQVRLRKKKTSAFQFIGDFLKGEEDKGSDTIDGVVKGSPTVDIRFFSLKIWHVTVMLLLILNGFLVTLFVQCIVYDLDEIYQVFGAVATALVPLPLIVNAVFFQRHIFYDFVIISNMLRIDSHTLSDVVENFSEIVRLRSEFATTLLQHLTQQELAISNLEAELKAGDTSNSGFIEVDDLRDVLSKFGFRLTRFRFNSVVKLLFELQDTTVAYTQVIHLVFMAQHDHHLEKTVLAQQSAHPLLRPSVLHGGQASMLSQSGYNLYGSTRQIPLLDQPSIGTEPCADDFLGSSFLLPSLSMHGGQQQSAIEGSSISSQACHDMFNLQRLSDSRIRSNTGHL